MRFDVLTIFPDMIDAYLREGLLGRSVERGILDVRLINLRDFARGPHRTTDDRPFGGGDGMVMKPGPISRALDTVERVAGRSRVVLLSPQGPTFDQQMAWDFSRHDQLILICGRYAGVDERIVTAGVDLELSLGDFVLSGGELAAMVVMEAVSRLIPGALGAEMSPLEDSFEDGLLEYPQYTRPRIFKEQAVPAVLLSGDHERIRRWRRKAALKRTLERRPDLLRKAKLNAEDEKILSEFGWEV